VVDRRVTGIALGALAGAAYATGPLFFKGSVLPAGVDWLVMLVWRFFFATIASWVWLFLQPHVWPELRKLDRRTVARLMFNGAFFMISASTYYAAIERIDISLVALLMSIYPALVAMLSWRLGYSYRGRLAWTALAMVIAGTVMTIGGVKAGTDSLGIVLALASPLFYCVYIVLTAWTAGERPGQTADMRSRGRGAEVSPPVAGAVMMTGTCLAALALGLVTGAPVRPDLIPAAAWPGLIGIGLFAAAIAIQAFYASAARIGAAQASLMATVEPVAVIFLGIAFLGEILTPLRIGGAAIVLIGVVVAQLATPVESRPTVLEEP